MRGFLAISPCELRRCLGNGPPRIVRNATFPVIHATVLSIMPRFAANLGYHFTERPLIERASALRLRLVSMLHPAMSALNFRSLLGVLRTWVSERPSLRPARMTHNGRGPDGNPALHKS